VGVSASSGPLQRLEQETCATGPLKGRQLMFPAGRPSIVITHNFALARAMWTSPRVEAQFRWGRKARSKRKEECDFEGI
jgi:hypothetical protein